APAPAPGAGAGAPLGGGAAGATTGALAGGVTGPVGAAIGAAAGAVVGALAGRSRADHDDYWRDNWSSRPYVQPGARFEDYEPAYRHGLDAHTRYPGRPYDEIEGDLGRDWQGTRGGSSLEWDHARHATRDAWQRVKDTAERAMPGDSDRDGR
ncbi:hypothetical protein, partial [Ideonella sp.]|uniref:hypothetical protein n=1 Tax=Ideonella sp. TaxID=1929293 RepID=UPI0035AF72B3